MLGREYGEYCSRFNAVWKYLVSCSRGIDLLVREICEYRLYYNCFDRWERLFRKVGVAFVTGDSCDFSRFRKEEFSDLALFTEEGKFLLEGRYIIPVRDMLGNVIALIGWFPDRKKYITTPSRFFSKDCLFFGLEQLSCTGLGASYFIVEGVFDCLALRSLGFNAVACMGISAGRVKEALYGLFGRVVAVPDCDEQGRKVISGDLWRLPRSGSYFRWVGEACVGGTYVSVKDIDTLCSLYSSNDVIGLLGSCLSSSGRVIKINL